MIKEFFCSDCYNYQDCYNSGYVSNPFAQICENFDRPSCCDCYLAPICANLGVISDYSEDICDSFVSLYDVFEGDYDG